MTIVEVLEEQDETIKRQADIIKGLSMLLLQAGVDPAPATDTPTGGE